MSNENRIWDAVPGFDWIDDRDLTDYPTWVLDMTHSWPRMMPMEAWFWMRFMNSEAMRWPEYMSVPTLRGGLRRLRYGTDCMCFIPITDEDEIAQRTVVFKKRLLEMTDNLPQWWERSKTELMDKYKQIKNFDFDSATDMDLSDHLYVLRDTNQFMWYVHWRGLMTVSYAWAEFEKICYELFEFTDLSPDFQKLMSGFDNKMLQVDKVIWQLAQSAIKKGISDIITADDPKELFKKLEKTKDGTEWMNEFKDFLDEHGWRIAHQHVFHEPTWVEDPSQAVKNIRGFIKRGGGLVSDEKRDNYEKQRTELEADLLLKVPEERKDEFRSLLQAAQMAGPFNEEHSYYCEHYCHGVIRRSLLGIGRRLVQTGVVDMPEDIFMLNLSEVVSIMPALSTCDLRWLVERRRREWEEWTKTDFAPILTKRSSVEEAFKKDISTWYMPIVDKIVSGSLPKIKPELKASLHGLSVSRGVAEGTARVIMNAEEIGQIQEGEILVTPYTSSSWTPLFAIIKAVVTDVGGTLSHTAIVSREYGVPAVTNVGDGTKKITTGQRIKVDGNEGVVYILEQ